MLNTLSSNKTAAILAKDGFEQCELIETRDALISAGVNVHIVSLEPGTIIGWNGSKWGIEVDVDKIVSNVSAEEYDALILPGGLFNPDALLQDKDAIDFVKGFFKDAEIKPVVAINQGTWMLLEADVLKNRLVASFPTVLNRLRYAGAKLVDRDLVIDKGLYTSRSSHNLAALNQQVIQHLTKPRMH
ncbi:type 1 glutamine amidotransferase domain-containing protein [Paraglaciecola sp. L1A13]|uniref:type 1 glutamine amidotransferase domain-containing protein n=1 Tax=Paraglaciecola sp. L1A13 TaxID=2686359 RepID=UPI00131ED098|nr:type 1 glutamine amidotransferase domain-containing protein [Paraglaciecola sp. L1A13]